MMLWKQAMAETHTNGRLNGAVGTDGIPNSVQSAPNNGVINYTVQDSDGDSTIDSLEADSDNDGCNDSDEAYGNTDTDSDSNGMYGSGSPAVDGNGVVSAATYQMPNDDNANGTYDYRESGVPPTITVQPQDQNVADGGNATFSVSASGVSFAYQWQISTDGGLNFSDISGATSSTYTVTGVSSSEDDNYYRALVTEGSFICNSTNSFSAILNIASDFDGDGIVDTDDRDDDNDGILDEVEANNCSIGDPAIDVVIFSEDFGQANGNRVTTPYTNYNFANGSGDLADGSYTIFEDISATASWAPSIWQTQGDHTTGTDRMAIFNANNTAGLEFYRRSLVQVVENVPLNISFWVMNLDIDQPSNNGRTEPDITVLIQQGGSTVYSFNTNAIAREENDSPEAWKNFTGSFTPVSNTTLELVLINNAPGGLGNDLALDDIQITQSFCDSDGDGIPNTLEADSDGDGCFDSDEAYYDTYADSDDNGMYGLGTPSVNPDGTVIGASYQVPHDGDGNGAYDYIEANTAPVITTHPADQFIIEGNDAVFSIDITGLNLEYQWELSTDAGATYGAISGATSNSYTESNVDFSNDNHLYRVVITQTNNVCNEVTSNSARLDVLTDWDGDGISDDVDFDDDNDGILDTDEHLNTILWVTDGTASSDQQNTINKLIGLGYLVTVRDDNDTGEDTNNYAATYIHPSVGSGATLANFANLVNTSRGIITGENALYDELLGTSPSGAFTNTNLMEITNNTHPITLGLPLGPLDIGDAAFHSTGLVSGTKLGYHPNGEVSMAVWDIGDPLDSGVAPGRRTIISHTSSNGGFNSVGEDLLVRAIVWTAHVDTDRDGIDNYLDLDSDNDGIYDAVEAGHGQTHTNGELIGGAGLDGVPDVVQGNPDGQTVNYTLENSDGDGYQDSIEADSDNDGCNDADEAYGGAGTDAGNNGMYGSGTPGIDGQAE